MVAIPASPNVLLGSIVEITILGIFSTIRRTIIWLWYHPDVLPPLGMTLGAVWIATFKIPWYYVIFENGWQVALWYYFFMFVVFPFVFAGGCQFRDMRKTARVINKLGGGCGACLKASPTENKKNSSNPHNRSWHTCVHEAGHAGVAVALGKRPTIVQVFDNSEGGWCGLSSWWQDPINNMAFLYGGQMAAGKSLGDWGDNEKIQGFAKMANRNNPEKAKAEAQSRAAWALNSSANYRSRVAIILWNLGTYR